MQAYLIVLEISPLKIGGTYDMLPLHCTLVHWFWLDQTPDEVTQKLSVALGSAGAMLLQAGAEQVFSGKTKDGRIVPVTVNDIDPNAAIRQLHNDACTVIEALGVRYAEPQYVRDGFHPHVTHQQDGKLASGETRESARLYLVSAAAPEYGNLRIVESAIDL